LLELSLPIEINFLELLNLHSKFLSGQRSDSLRSFIKSIDNDFITDVSSFVLSFFLIHKLPEDFDDEVLIVDFFVELFDKLASFMLLGESFDGSLLLFKNLD
jgi:hypothetical protein